MEMGAGVGLGFGGGAGLSIEAELAIGGVGQQWAGEGWGLSGGL